MVNEWFTLGWRKFTSPECVSWKEILDAILQSFFFLLLATFYSEHHPLSPHYYNSSRGCLRFANKEKAKNIDFSRILSEHVFPKNAGSFHWSTFFLCYSGMSAITADLSDLFSHKRISSVCLRIFFSDFWWTLEEFLILLSVNVLRKWELLRISFILDL